METMYKQCELTRPLLGGICRMVSWIPERIAIPGKTVRLKDIDTGEWTEGWKVLYASDPSLPEKMLLKNSRDYRKTRAASDI